ncbi:GNAT family N-acetyltransferase [Deinococcus hopiensis]|uniref:Predicted N-acetyltransferase YhbS n=1 Tax=Deinococcus hopiensis KR-140 TaxID=695939 RepID=A0A1W1V5T7_9DEIO|nr:GNAT family N-acetyltransferase [Deinococcus hopiensis]SMB88718.1 Predicted N-acetyltransferase YhbS [Deinococcus hopiensis KR-140]
MTLLLRSYADADAPAVSALVNGVTGRETTPESLRAEDVRRDPAKFHRRWVAEREGEIQGLGLLNASPFTPPGFLQATILVAPRARGQGVGGLLWREMEAASREEGAAGLSADVLDGDPSSRAWAERRGFCEHAHRFASELDLGTFDESLHAQALRRAEDQRVTFTDLRDADEATVERYLNFVADRLPETPDLTGHPRWPLAQIRETFHLNHDPRPDWLILAVSKEGEWLGTTAMVVYRHANMAYNEFTAVHPEARGRGLALPLKLHAICRARKEGLGVMRTNNHSRNAPMLAVNRRLGFRERPGRFEMHLGLKGNVTSDV